MNRIFYFILLFASIGCHKSLERDNPIDGKTLPFITTLTHSNPTSTSAVAGAIISKDGGLPITAKGIIYSLTPNVAVLSAQKVSSGTGFTNFSTLLPGLNPATTYYYRAFATNLVGTAYGAEMSFKTSNDKPSITTVAPPTTGITANNLTVSAILNSSNGLAVTQKGFVLSSTPYTDTISTKIFATSIVKIDSTANTTFSTVFTSLKEATPFYIMAFARNSLGVKFGNVITTKTDIKEPTVETSQVIEIASTTAKFGGQILNEGGAVILSKGLVWSEKTGPTLENSTTFTNVVGTNLTYESVMTPLIPGTTYYVRAYAKNSKGTGYGAERTFKATPLGPQIAAASFVNKFGSSVELSATIIYDGGSPVLDYGFVYSFNTTNPSISNADKLQIATSVGGKNRNISFSSTIDKLQSGKKYYINSYVTTAISTAYGSSILEYETAASKPRISTNSASNPTFTSAQINGTIISNGGQPITEKGVLVGTTTNLVYNGSGNFTFFDQNMGDLNNINVNATGLVPDQSYYALAFAKNSIGYGFGDPQLIFTTNSQKPVLSTITQTGSSTSSSVAVNGAISNTYNFPITEKGFIWSKSTTMDAILANRVGTHPAGSGSGSFSHSITDLEPGTKYAIVSFAKNTPGFGYSNIFYITTSMAAPTVQNTNAQIVSSSSVILSGKIISDGGAALSNAGFIIYTKSGQTRTGVREFPVSNPSVGDISITGTSLTRGVTYYYRIFAKNSANLYKENDTEGQFIIP